MSLAFNYCFMALWISEYGEREGMKRYMSDFNPNKGPAAASLHPPPASAAYRHFLSTLVLTDSSVAIWL